MGSPHEPSEATRELCLSLPDTEEVSRHGAPNFKVGGKTFAMFVLNHHGDGRVALWLNSPQGAQQLHTQFDHESYFVPPYVGVKGWLGMELNKNLKWSEIYARVREAYEHAAQSLPDIPLYYGVNGWINLDVQNGVNWDEVDGLLENSYRLIALKRMLKALDT